MLTDSDRAESTDQECGTPWKKYLNQYLPLHSYGTYCAKSGETENEDNIRLGSYCSQMGKLYLEPTLWRPHSVIVHDSIQKDVRYFARKQADSQKLRESIWITEYGDAYLQFTRSWQGQIASHINSMWHSRIIGVCCNSKVSFRSWKTT